MQQLGNINLVTQQAEPKDSPVRQARLLGWRIKSEDI